MRVLCLTRYGTLGASSRVRVYQFAPALQELGISLTVAPLLDDRYLVRQYRGEAVGARYLAGAYARHLLRALSSRRFDLVWVEKELLPYAPAWLEALALARVPYVVDYDDATFHVYDQHPRKVVRALLGRKIDGVMRRAALVVAGNDYLAARAEAAGARRVEVLPSVVDLSAYPSAPPARSLDRTPRIGWMGSPGSETLLTVVGPALRSIVADGVAEVVLIGASSHALPEVPHERREWTEAGEPDELARLDVGIMPVWDAPFTRGKCGYKLVQYGAAWLPSVASPVGVNARIITPDFNGFHATTEDEWEEGLRLLSADPALRSRMGEAARKRVADGYTIQAVAPRLAAMLHAAATRADVVRASPD